MQYPQQLKFSVGLAYDPFISFKASWAALDWFDKAISFRAAATRTHHLQFLRLLKVVQ
jgi:hypothetical protein